MGLFDKSLQVLDAMLDDRLAKAKASATPTSETKAETPAYDRKAYIEVDPDSEQQFGWKEKRGLVGNGVLKNMGRKDSIAVSIILTRISQICQFAQPQKDPYSPGFKFFPKEPADLTREEKLQLADPELDDEAYEKLKYELEQKRSKRQAKQEKEIAEAVQFVLHCGISPDETDTTYTRCDFDRCMKLWVMDRLIYNYSATELVPTKDRSKLHHFYPVSAGTIKYVSLKSAEQYEKTVKQQIDAKAAALEKTGIDSKTAMAQIREAYKMEGNKPFRYVQVLRGQVVAAWTEDQMVYEAGIPTIDPEDNGYAMGELEFLIQIVTAHLYAEAHNRNYFTQGIGSKGILHIKGNNISRGQLEGFKRNWFNQLANTRNAFRPPIIGLADEVKWIELAQSNKDMEFDNWMHYLIKVMCAIYQIDPAEINFDITKGTTSTLNEANNEERIKSSRDKGLKPLLNYIENLLNRNILPRWNKEFAEAYEFKFVGLDAETREQEMKRLETETKVWKTVNEARVEMGRAPIEHGDVILSATYTQYLAQKQEAVAAEEQPGDMPEEADMSQDEGAKSSQDLMSQLDELEKQVDKDLETEKKDAEKKKKEEATKKSQPTVVEYFTDGDDGDEG